MNVLVVSRRVDRIDQKPEYHASGSNNMSRLDQIQSMLEQEPNDTFLRYALAMELKKTDPDRALEVFASLQEETPPHVSSFFMAGQLLAQLERVNEARTVLRDGIEEARKQNNGHAAGEMSEFLASLGSLGE